MLGTKKRKARIKHNKGDGECDGTMREKKYFAAMQRVLSLGTREAKKGVAIKREEKTLNDRLSS